MKIENTSSQLKTYLFILICSIVIASCAYYKISTVEKAEFHQSSEVKLVDAENICVTLPKFYEELAIRNLDKMQIKKNANIIKQLDQVVGQINIGNINEHFNYNELQPAELVNSIYNLNAISSYALIIEHDAIKAEKVLEYAKTIAENYVIHKSQISIDFDKLSAEEIYNALALIRDLPEMYAATVYFLGRSNIYQKNIDKAEKYFEISRYLGEKLGLFIETLSDIGGLAIIKGDRVEIDIKNGNFIEAKSKIKESLAIYEKAKDNNREYKKDYRPNNYDPKLIIPKQDIHNILECNKRIMKLYTKLILITNDHSEKINYLDEITDILIGNFSTRGILEILTNNDKNLSKMIADSYNILGELLIVLHDDKINFDKIKNAIMEKLSLSNNTDLEVIGNVFETAKSLSNDNEFTKADGYNGLAKVHERILKQDNISDAKRKMLRIQLQNDIDNRDKINQKLKRAATS